MAKTPKKLLLMRVTASEENYQMLDQQKVEFFIPYNTYRIEQKRRHKNNPFHAQNLYYNIELDFLVCPMGQRMNKIYTKESKTTTGFLQQHSVYQAQNCQGCPMRGQCFNAKGNRRIEINHNLQRLKAKARENLESEKGKETYAKRCIEPEPVFGNIKQNKHFKRFSLRKLPKINIEFGLVAIAHNFAKWIEKIRLLNFGQNHREIDRFKAILNHLFSTNYKCSMRFGNL